MTLEPVQTKAEELLFFSDNEHDADLGCIGHLRMDFGSSGKEFHTTWFPHACSDKMTPTRSAKFDDFINNLREDILNDRDGMRKYCRDKDEARNMHGISEDCWGFRAFDGGTAFYLRCNPQAGDYDGYCYVYDRNTLME